MGRHSIGSHKKKQSGLSRAAKSRHKGRKKRLSSALSALAVVPIVLGAYAFLKFAEVFRIISVKPAGLVVMTAVPGIAYLLFLWGGALLKRKAKLTGVGKTPGGQDGRVYSRKSTAQEAGAPKADAKIEETVGTMPPELVRERVSADVSGLELGARGAETEAAVLKAMEEFVADAPILTSDSETVEIDVPLGSKSDESEAGTPEIDGRTSEPQAPKKSPWLGSLFGKRSGRSRKGLDDRDSRAAIKLFRSDGVSPNPSGSNGSGTLPKPTTGPIPGSVVRPSSYADEYAVYRDISSSGDQEAPERSSR